MVAKSWLLISTIVLSSCDNTDEPMPVEEAEGDVTEYAFFDPSNPANVSICEAEDVATAFMNEIGSIDNTFKSKGMAYNKRNTHVIPDENYEPAIYIINLEPDGFCVVSATNKTESILAYSDQGKFDLENLPEGLAEWLCENAEIIQYVRNCEPEGQSTTPPVYRYDSGGGAKNGGTKGTTKSYTETYGPLLQTEWGQFYPFNNMCPESGCNGINNNCAAGCVAVAAAQVVRYYHPIMVYNFNPYYWSDMPNSTRVVKQDEYIRKDRGYTSMARLIHDIGVAVGMDYGCDKSGAETEKITGVLTNKFGFYCGGNYQELSNSKATPKLIDNIKHKRPVIMSGYKTKKLLGLVYKDGHAWVCDGYKKITHKKGGNVTDTEEYFHMNWGWAGEHNGWFTLDLKLFQSDNGDNKNMGYIYKKRYITDIKLNPNADL